MSNLTRLDAFCGDGEVNVIVETPKGRRNKYDYEPKERLFTLSKVLPARAVFPFGFGFVPSTLCEDGDPLDIVLLMDEPAFPGCKIQARLIGVIEAEQTEKDGKTVRNGRLLAAAKEGCTYCAVRSLHDLPPGLLDCIEHLPLPHPLRPADETHSGGERRPPLRCPS